MVAEEVELNGEFQSSRKVNIHVANMRFLQAHWREAEPDWALHKWLVRKLQYFHLIPGIVEWTDKEHRRR